MSGVCRLAGELLGQPRPCLLGDAPKLQRCHRYAAVGRRIDHRDALGAGIGDVGTTASGPLTDHSPFLIPAANYRPGWIFKGVLRWQKSAIFVTLWAAETHSTLGYIDQPRCVRFGKSEFPLRKFLAPEMIAVRWKILSAHLVLPKMTEEVSRKCKKGSSTGVS